MSIQHPTPEGARPTTPTAANLASSLNELVEVYWGDEGDGGEPPECIMHAKRLLAAYVKAKGQ